MCTHNNDSARCIYCELNTVRAQRDSAKNVLMDASILIKALANQIKLSDLPPIYVRDIMRVCGHIDRVLK